MATTAWGKADVVEEVTVKQTASGKEFATRIELLEIDNGDELVRFSYATRGNDVNGDGGLTSRRGPVTLRAADLTRLRKSLQKTPRLRKALEWGS